MRALSQMRGLYSTQIEKWRTIMENALPWNKKPVQDARDTKIKQLQHEILRKGISWTISVACSQKKANFLWEEKARGAKWSYRDFRPDEGMWKRGLVKARAVASPGIDERTIQRWKLSKLREDCRKSPSQPASSFSQEELQAI